MYVLEAKRLDIFRFHCSHVWQGERKWVWRLRKPSAQNPVFHGVSCSLLTAFLKIYWDSSNEPCTCSSYLLCIQPSVSVLDILVSPYTSNSSPASWSELNWISSIKFPIVSFRKTIKPSTFVLTTQLYTKSGRKWHTVFLQWGKIKYWRGKIFN